MIQIPDWVQLALIICGTAILGLRIAFRRARWMPDDFEG